MNMSIRAETSISGAEFPTHGPLGEEEVETLQFWDFKIDMSTFFCVDSFQSMCFEM